MLHIATMICNQKMHAISVSSPSPVRGAEQRRAANHVAVINDFEQRLLSVFTAYNEVNPASIRLFNLSQIIPHH